MAATNKRGVFSLETTLERQSDNNWVKIPEVFRYVNQAAPIPVGTDFGYFMGGAVESYSPSANFSDVDRLDFSNDTADMVSKAFLPTGKGYMRGFSSLTHGYTSGGYAPAFSTRMTTIDRIDYANDTAAQTAKGPLEFGVSSNNVGLHNTEYGYTLGGSTSSTSFTSYNQRLEFANDTTTTAPKGNLTQNKNYGAGAGNQSYGYYSGGGTPSRISSVERLDYSTDTATLAPKGPLSRVVNEHDAAGNADYGYHAGGWDPGSPYSTINDRIDYSNDTATALVRGVLGYPGRHGPTATGNSTHGYWTGGYGNTTNSYRLDYSSDTTTTSIKGKRTRFSQNGCGTSSRANALPTTTSMPVPATRTEAGMTPVPNFGYFAGGMWPVVSTIDRIDYANDTATAAVKGPLDRDLLAQQSTSNSTHGYFAGGEPSGTSKVSRMEFSNDTATTSPKGPLSAVQKYFGAAGNLSFGYYAGNAPSNISTVSRIDYSNDTATALAKGPLSFAKGNAQGCGNLSFGYFAGGNGNKSSVDRIDYSNDTATASAKGPLENSRSTMVASGTSDFGYWSGGYPYYTKASRIDYANDTATAVAKAPYPSTVTPYGFSNSAGTGNSTHGYAAGGNGYNSYVWRIDYANDTANGVQKGPLSQGRLRLSGVSPLENALPSKAPGLVDKGADGYQVVGPLGPAYGYFAGGSGISTVQRIDYSSDSSTPLVRGSLSSEHSKGGGTGNITHGYALGGDAPSGSSKVDRVDYASDTSTASVRGPLSTAGSYMQSIGNANFGYSGGRNTNTSIIDRVDYSNDTATASIRNPAGMTPGGVNGYSTTGNQSFGYFIGGLNPAGSDRESTVRRLDYSSDSTATAPKGPLTATTQYATATGNANFGYTTSTPYGNAGTKIDRIEYANDTATAVTKGNLNTPGYMRASTGSADFGYFGGGIPSYSNVDRIDYSNDTASASAKGNLSTGTRHMQPFSSQEHGLIPTSNYIPRIRWVDSFPETTYSSSVGYAELGENRSLPYPYNTSFVDRIDFSNDTVAASPVANFSTDAGGNSTRSHSFSSPTHGYAASRSPYRYEKMEFSNDTTTTVTTATYSIPSEIACSSNAHFGYVGGGNNRTAIYRYDYANDNTNVVQKGPLSTAKYWFSANGNQNYGYFNSAIVSWSSTYTSIVDRIDYSNDTPTASPKGTLTVVDAYEAGLNSATGNADYSWIGGGFNRSIVNRIDYSNDTAQASLKGSLVDNQAFKGSTGNHSYGYFFGGQNSRSVVDRVDYSNDTSTASPKGPLSSTRYWQGGGGMGAAKNGNILPTPVVAPYQPPFPFPVQLSAPPPPGPAYGYYGGGSDGNPVSNVDRVDYSNDTATASPKGPLDATRYALAATGNGSYGYFAGGRNQGTKVDRVDYSNDTAEALDKGSLNTGRYRHGAVGNADFGYFGGGNTPGNSPTSTIDRIDYSNDTATAAEKGPLSSTVFNVVDGTGNSNFGYLAPGGNSIVHRIDYSNDTATAGEKGPLSRNAVRVGATGNADFGYFAGGGPFGSEKTTVDRLDYASDTTTAAVKGPLASARYWCGSTGSSSFGYVGGGAYPAKSFVDRIDYANDTATASPKGPLSDTKYAHGATSARANGLPN